MNKDTECKIVNDLLPMYIDNLTSEDTNKFIEEHLKSCKECKEVFNNMNVGIDMEEIEEQTNINELKKYKRNQKIKLIAVVLVVVLICFGLFQIYTRFHIEKDENGKLSIVSSRAEYNKSDLEYIIYDAEIKNKDNSENVKTKILLTIDDNKCISARFIESGYINPQQQYSNIINSSLQLYGNVKLEEDCLIYNDNYLTGKNINEVKEIINKKYIIINTFEI